MSTPFQTIGLIAKSGAPAVAHTLTTLIEDLRQRDLRVVLDESAAVYFQRPEEAVLNRWELAKGCDLAIVVGGDGTLLNAARSLAEVDVAVLGVNLGRLGILADVSPDEMHERLDEILAGLYQEEHRSLIHASVLRDGRTVSESDALNDVVVHKWDIARMIEVDTSID
ncbi:MAG: NAD(+)/NADH kinase, partial [Thiogranum sp.]